MRRREFIGLALASSIPGITFAQQAPPTIGFLFGGTLQKNVETFAAFKKGLAQEGLFEGQHYAILAHWAAFDFGGLSDAANKMIRGGARLIVAAGGNEAVSAAIAAGRSMIPVVFATGGDPVSLNFVRQVARPDANVTGATFYFEVEAKIVGLIERFFPSIKRYEILRRGDERSNRRAQRLSEYLTRSGSSFRISITDNRTEVEAAIGVADGWQATALLYLSDAMFNSIHPTMVSAARAKGIALFGYTDEQCESGAILTYGTSRPEMFRQLGSYAGRILKGTPVSELPVVYLERYELCVNTRAAAAVGLPLPPDLIALADKVYS